MSLTETIRKDMFNASKEARVEESSILKMALASIKNVEIDSDTELTDSDIQKILQKEVKKIKDSIDQFTQMNRLDLVEKEQIQLEVLERYIPKSLTEEELNSIILAKKTETGVKDMRDMGKLMGMVMKEVNGRADGNLVKELVQNALK